MKQKVLRVSAAAKTLCAAGVRSVLGSFVERAEPYIPAEATRHIRLTVIAPENQRCRTCKHWDTEGVEELFQSGSVIAQVMQLMTPEDMKRSYAGERIDGDHLSSGTAGRVWRKSYGACNKRGELTYSDFTCGAWT